MVQEQKERIRAGNNIVPSVFVLMFKKSAFQVLDWVDPLSACDKRKMTS